MSIKFNPFTNNFDFVGSGSSSGGDNFSYYDVPVGVTINVPAGQQMLIDGHITVSGHLLVSGQVLDISNRVQEKFFYDLIDTNEVVHVQSNRLLLYKDHLTVDGMLRVNGRVAQV